MKKRLATAVNVGVIIAIFIVLMREEGGLYLAAAFAVVIGAALIGWLYFRRRTGGDVDDG